MSIKGVARPGGYAISRVVRSKGYRSKDPAANGGVSSDVFSDSALRHAVSDTVRDFRGNTRLAPDFPGLFAYQMHGARVIR